jgi:hypothetical protein
LTSSMWLSMYSNRSTAADRPRRRSAMCGCRPDGARPRAEPARRHAVAARTRPPCDCPPCRWSRTSVRRIHSSQPRAVVGMPGKLPPRTAAIEGPPGRPAVERSRRRPTIAPMGAFGSEQALGRVVDAP